MAIERLGFQPEDGERGRDNVGVLLVIGGVSGSGKSTVVDLLVQEHPTIRPSVSTTTREPRADEIHGQHYYFVGKDEFQQRMDRNEFLETNPYREHMYGTHRKALLPVLAGEDVVLVLNLDGNADAFMSSIDDDIKALEQLKEKEGIHVVVNRDGKPHHAMHEVFDLVHDRKRNLEQKLRQQRSMVP